MIKLPKKPAGTATKSSPPAFFADTGAPDGITENGKMSPSTLPATSPIARPVATQGTAHRATDRLDQTAEETRRHRHQVLTATFFADTGAPDGITENGKMSPSTLPATSPIARPVSPPSASPTVPPIDLIRLPKKPAGTATKSSPPAFFADTGAPDGITENGKMPPEHAPGRTANRFSGAASDRSADGLARQ